MKSPAKEILAVVTILCLCQVGTAMPVVSQVEGDVSDGMSVTITGTSFGPKNQAKPLFWATFEDGEAFSSLGRNTTWVNPFDNVVPAGGMVTEKNYSGNNSWRWDCHHNNGLGFSFNSDYLYVSLKRFYDFDIMDPAEQGERGFNLKTQRLWAMPWGEKNNVLLGYQAADGVPGGNPRANAEYTGGNTCWPGFHQIHGEWMNEEIIYRVGDLGVQNGVFDYYRDCESMWDREFVMRNNEYPNKYGFLALDQVSNGTGPGAQWIYYDNIYIDETYSRVVIGDNVAYGSCTVYEPQIPSAWSENSIEVTINQGSFKDGDTAYVFVVDSSDFPSLVGKQIVFGKQMANIRTVRRQGRMGGWTDGQMSVYDVLGRSIRPGSLMSAGPQARGVRPGGVWFVVGAGNRSPMNRQLVIR